MQFLKALFLVTITVLAVLFGIANWIPVELKLGDIIVSIKLPMLVLAAFLLGFLPTFAIYRARLWALNRRLETRANAHVANQPAPAPPRAMPTANAPDRQATDSKAWPAE